MSDLMRHSDLPFEIERLSKQVVDCVFAVHRELGAGLLERIYEEALFSELCERGIACERQKQVPVFYKGKALASEYRIDLLVGDVIVLELKTLERILPVHEAQIMTYMRLVHAPLGFIVNFNTPLIKHGIKRMVMSDNLGAFASSR